MIQVLGYAKIPRESKHCEESGVEGRLRESTKHRVKKFLLGLVFFLVGGLLLTPCVTEFGTGRFSCYLYGFIHIGSDIPLTHLLPLGFFGIGTYLLMALAGIAAMYSAFKPVKYKLRHCPSCSEDTQQFEAGTKYKDGFRAYKSDWFSTKVATKDEKAANLEGYYYVCEKCGKKTMENVLASKETAEPSQIEPVSSGVGAKRKSWREWLNQPIGAKKAARFAEPTGGSPRRQAKPTKFCRECGAKIPRDSIYCEECGTSLA